MESHPADHRTTPDHGVLRSLLSESNYQCVCPPIRFIGSSDHGNHAPKRVRSLKGQPNVASGNPVARGLIQSRMI